MNFSPEQMKMAQEFMKNPEAVKMGENMMQNMSDDQIKNMYNQYGMGHVDPNFVRNASKNIDPANMPNMPPNFNPSMPQQNISPNASQNFSQNSAPLDQPNPYTKITKLKVKGTELFKECRWGEAAVTWYEGILEVEEILERANPDGLEFHKIPRHASLKELEVSLGLNYCAAKVKLSEWDDVIRMGRRILRIEKHGKAMFRIAQGYFGNGDLDMAEEYIIAASGIFPNDLAIQAFGKTVKEKLQGPEVQKDSTPELAPVQDPVDKNIAEPKVETID
jgi:hypothetical protein